MGLTPAETASLLAQLKARAVAAVLAAEGVRDALILGCDSVFELVPLRQASHRSGGTRAHQRNERQLRCAAYRSRARGSARS